MPKPHVLRLGTRSSNLAMTQSGIVARRLMRAHPGLKVQLVEISTTGDEVRDKPLQSFGGAGVFVKELENALVDDRVDFAVHSLKDMPTRQPEGLLIAAVAGREDPRDVLVLRGGQTIDALPSGSIIGSGSTRRRLQLKAAYPKLEFAEIRGNVETRLRKVREGQYAGTVLARAGLKRLGLLPGSKRSSRSDAAVTEGLSFHLLPLELMLPAPGQGALGIECRSSDARTRRLLKVLHDPEAAACVEAERTVLGELGGGCHLPLAALGKVVRRGGKAMLELRAVLGLPDASIILRAERLGSLRAPQKIGISVAQDLLSRGGKEVLAKLG
ncbi:MAG TPA: hydroxymethylbilane synthase [Planctomycetota bacterium]|nr:hydroxymethylbilane synthase [Planctomycetota bacterium]